mmetsp:Transcript_11569/g.28874  ORF Transcript_11569/g.28874 Transcript_11569/m.28874 type:complete len:242 (-) Transcript_11569:159-884(-)
MACKGEGMLGGLSPGSLGDLPSDVQLARLRRKVPGVTRADQWPVKASCMSFKVFCKASINLAVCLCLDVAQKPILSSLMMYPIPNPSCSTGPKPNIRSAGFPQLLVLIMMRERVFQPCPSYTSGTAPPASCSARQRIAYMCLMPLPSDPSLTNATCASAALLIISARLSGEIATSSNDRARTMLSLVTENPASVRPWKNLFVIRVSYVLTLSLYIRWYATWKATCTKASGLILLEMIKFLP